MKNKTKILVLAAGFCVFLAGAFYAYDSLSREEQASPGGIISSEQDSKGQAPKNIRQKAPDFTVNDKDGQPVKLSAFLGKPVVLNFWASWCPPCRSEMPEFEQVYREVGAEVNFMLVDLVDGQRETVEKGKGFISERRFTFPVYFDTAREAAYQYQINVIPTTIFIDREGYIVARVQGALDAAGLKKGIENIK